MKHDTNISIERYSGDDALDVLLTDLTSEAADLLADLIAVMTADQWLALDIHAAEHDYQVVVYDTRTHRKNRYRFAGQYPALLLALQQDLLTPQALMSAVHPAHSTHSTTDVIRLCLSEGVRTPLSKGRGFRWEVDDHYLHDVRLERIENDLYRLAGELEDQGITGDVKWLKADTEEVDVVVQRVIVASLPFDHYPFLGEAILRTDDQKLTGRNVDILNIFLEAVREER